MPNAIRNQSKSRGTDLKNATTPDASWWSVQFAAGEMRRLTAERLLADARGAKQCVVVSAYLAMDWFDGVLLTVDTNCKVSLHLNAAELLRKPKLRTQLGERIERDKPSLRIRLHQPPGGIFHTKLYAFHNGRSWTIWAGSANGSSQAFEVNEELMLRARGNIVSPLLGYIESLENDGSPFDNATATLAMPDARALLLAGRLYLRRDWFSGLRLPIEVRTRPREKEQNKAPLGYVAPKGKSSFDVATALGIKQQDKNRSRIKKLTLATCYGLWAPQALRQEIDADRRRVQAHREAMLARVWDANISVGESKLRKRFEDVLDFVTERQWRDSRNGLIGKWNPEEAFQRFYERLFGRWERGHIARPGRLSPEMRAQMANPVYSGIIPDVFNDPTVGEDFLGSFFESLEAESYKAKSQNRLWHTVRRFCDLESRPYSADEIRLRLEAFLKVLKFDENSWKSEGQEGEDGELTGDDADDDEE